MLLPPAWVFPTVAASTWLGETIHRHGRIGIVLTWDYSHAFGNVGPLDYDR